jgi:hypothetical protein
MTYALKDKSFLAHPFVMKFSALGLSLQQRIQDFEHAPKVRQDDVRFFVNNGTDNLGADTTEFSAETAKEGLCILFGYGMVKYNYDLPIFKGLPDQELSYYLLLTAEIFDRRLHVDWMVSRGHAGLFGDLPERFAKAAKICC